MRPGPRFSCVFLAILLSAAPVSAQLLHVYVEAPDHVFVGEEFSAELRIENAQSLFTASYALEYSETLEFMGMEQGDIFGEGSVRPILAKQPTQEEGKLSDIITTRILNRQGISGDGTLGVFKFRAKNAGFGEIRVTRLSLANASKQRLSSPTVSSKFVFISDKEKETEKFELRPVEVGIDVFLMVVLLAVLAVVLVFMLRAATEEVFKKENY